MQISFMQNKLILSQTSKEVNNMNTFNSSTKDERIDYFFLSPKGKNNRTSSQRCCHEKLKAGIKIFSLLLLAYCLLPVASQAQVNAVEFGKNRVQYKKFKWQYYQSKNFNTYFSQNGQELAKFVAQVAEKELPAIESFL
jgi:hypothetical protein